MPGPVLEGRLGPTLAGNTIKVGPGLLSFLCGVWGSAPSM
jgi:hypothetical protein